jgi:hypothetical protein
MHQNFKINKSLHLTPYLFKYVNSLRGCMLRLLIGYMKRFWPGLMEGAQKQWNYSVVDVN